MPIFMWVVYNSPKDFPGEVMARIWKLGIPTDHILRGKPLNKMREFFDQKGFAKMDPFAEDDPAILEVWL